MKLIQVAVLALVSATSGIKAHNINIAVGPDVRMSSPKQNLTGPALITQSVPDTFVNMTFTASWNTPRGKVRSVDVSWSSLLVTPLLVADI